MKEEYDVIIVGTGVAGLYGALRFVGKKANVLLISKRELALSNSSLAQGGVACVLDTVNDNYQLHFNDTMIAGKHKNNEEAVRVLVEEGPSDVLKLKEYGVEFDIATDGTLAKTLEAGHSRHRIVHHKDSTGKAIVDALIEEVKKHKNITIVENTTVYTIEKATNGFVLGLISDNGDKLSIKTHYCMLCTGGIGRVYKYTTNSAIATGDGNMIAHHLGAEIKNLSYIQFHPTAFAAEENRERFLISEAVRGEGAHLLNCEGKSFTKKYDERGDLAPRDVVSNAIIRESLCTKSENFYLDISHKDEEFLKNRFPMIYEKCLQEGVDITKDKIPVFPCQHYLMGGIDINLNGQTCVDRLYAAGECSHSGVHGANRLASNSLLEALVFSRRAADDIMKRIDANRDEMIENVPTLQQNGTKKLPTGVRTEIRSIMQKVCFVLPKPELQEEALKRVGDIMDMLNDVELELTRDLIEAKSLAFTAYTVLNESVNRNND